MRHDVTGSSQLSGGRGGTTAGRVGVQPAAVAMATLCCGGERSRCHGGRSKVSRHGCHPCGCLSSTETVLLLYVSVQTQQVPVFL